MRKILVISLWLVAIGAWLWVLAPCELGETTTPEVTIIKIAKANPNPYHKLYDELLYPSVRISAGMGTGSGVVIETTDTHGYTLILTAAHVVGDYSTVTATFYYCHEDTKTLSADVVITDTLKDLALLKITTDKPYPYVAKLAPRNYQPYLFTEVWTVGCSLGLPPRPSSGHICAICGSYWEMSAPIVPGNSGGGVFLQSNHQLIGIAVWVKVYRRQLITTMAGVVPLQNIYEFLDSYEGQIGSPDTAGRDNR